MLRFFVTWWSRDVVCALHDIRRKEQTIVLWGIGSQRPSDFDLGKMSRLCSFMSLFLHNCLSHYQQRAWQQLDASCFILSHGGGKYKLKSFSPLVLRRKSVWIALSKIIQKNLNFKVSNTRRHSVSVWPGLVLVYVWNGLVSVLI